MNVEKCQHGNYPKKATVNVGVIFISEGTLILVSDL